MDVLWFCAQNWRRQWSGRCPPISFSPSIVPPLGPSLFPPFSLCPSGSRTHLSAVDMRLYPFLELSSWQPTKRKNPFARPSYDSSIPIDRKRSLLRPLIDRQTDRQTDLQTDRQTDGRTDGNVESTNKAISWTPFLFFQNHATARRLPSSPFGVCRCPEKAKMCPGTPNPVRPSKSDTSVGRGGALRGPMLECSPVLLIAEHMLLRV